MKCWHLTLYQALLTNLATGQSTRYGIALLLPMATPPHFCTDVPLLSFCVLLCSSLLCLVFCSSLGVGYSVCLKADRTPVQVIVTNGPRQFSTHGTVITISVEALFQPTWSEIRAGLRTKLQPTTAIYADSSSVVQHLLGPDLLERSWKNRGDGGDMSNPVCVSNGVSEASSRPSHKSFFSKRWSMRWLNPRG